MSFIDCKHEYDFVCSSNGIGEGMDSHNVDICKNCGQFRVHTRKGGVAVGFTFNLMVPEHVEYAGKYVEYLVENGVTYPPQKPKYQVRQLEDKRFIHGHVVINDDELWHVPLDSTNTITLCGEPIAFVSRGLINATCVKCREVWHGKNPVDTDKDKP